MGCGRSFHPITLSYRCCGEATGFRSEPLSLSTKPSYHADAPRSIDLGKENQKSFFEKSIDKVG
jgi:hypothetical protein